jgi:transposase InsO family protein
MTQMSYDRVGEFRGQVKVSWFRNLFDARRQIETWRGHYNTERPHSSLGYRTPEQFAALNPVPVNPLLMWRKGLQTPHLHPR